MDARVIKEMLEGQKFLQHRLDTLKLLTRDFREDPNDYILELEEEMKLLQKILDLIGAVREARPGTNITKKDIDSFRDLMEY